MDFGEGQAFLAAHGAALSKQLAADPLVGEYLPTGSEKTRIIGEKARIAALERRLSEADSRRRS